MDKTTDPMNLVDGDAQPHNIVNASHWIAADRKNIGGKSEKQRETDQEHQRNNESTSDSKDKRVSKLTEYEEHCKEWEIGKEKKEIAAEVHEEKRRKHRYEEELERIENERRRDSSWRWSIDYLQRFGRDT